MSARVRYIVNRDGDIVHYVEQDDYDTYEMLKIARGYDDCFIWALLAWGWCYIPPENRYTTPWRQGIPPETVLMAHMIGEG